MFATHAAVNVPVAHGEIAGSQSDSMVDAITGSEVTFGAMAGNTTNMAIIKFKYTNPRFVQPVIILNTSVAAIGLA